MPPPLIAETKEDPDQLLAPKQVCEMLSIKKTTLYAIMTRGEIPYVMVGRSRRIRIADLRDYIAANRRSGQADPGSRYASQYPHLAKGKAKGDAVTA